MSVLVVGMSHRSAPVALLERLSMDADVQHGTAAALVARPSLSEAMIISTCNRLELYLDAELFHEAVDHAVAAISGTSGLAEHEADAFSWRNCLSEEGGSHLPVADGSDALVVVVGEKGAGQRRLTVHGDAGHGSAPFGRDMAVAKIGEVARRIAAIEPPVRSDELWEGYVRAWKFDPATEKALLAGEGYEAFGQLESYSHAMSHLTISPTVLRAGNAINVLPSVAWMELDIRPLPGQTQEDIDQVLRDALGDLAGEVEITPLITEDGTVSPTSGPLYDAIVSTFDEFFPGAPVIPTIAAGGSDLRFARRKGGVGYGFALHGREETLGSVLGELHSHDESVAVEDVDLTVRAYRSLLRRFVGA